MPIETLLVDDHPGTHRNAHGNIECRIRRQGCKSAAEQACGHDSYSVLDATSDMAEAGLRGGAITRALQQLEHKLNLRRSAQPPSSRKS
jgi:hypothetical protein